MSIESVMPSNHLVLSSPSPLALQLAQFRVFPNMLALHIRWPKYWSFSFSISPSNEYSESISFRINWFDLLAVQETLKSLLQHHSSKASVLPCSAFFVVTLTSIYGYWKTHSFDYTDLCWQTNSTYSPLDWLSPHLLQNSLTGIICFQNLIASMLTYFLHWLSCLLRTNGVFSKIWLCQLCLYL